MNNTLDSVVRRLFSDEQFRAAATNNPDQALAPYGLSEFERRSLIILCQALAAADSLALERSLGLLAQD